MPQFLLEGNPAHESPLTTVKQIERTWSRKLTSRDRLCVFCFVARCTVKLLDGRERSFYARQRCSDRVQQRLNSFLIGGRNQDVLQLTRRIQDTIFPDKLVKDVEERGQTWYQNQRIDVEWIQPVERLLSGIKPTQLFPLTKHLRFVIAAHTLVNDKIMVELMASFVNNRHAGDRLIRVVQNQTSISSIYYLVNDEEFDELKHIITLCNRKRVSDILDR